jgi:hypothetical protein
MRAITALAFGVFLSLAGALPASADVQITMHDGRVSIVAKDATLRQILAEWARVGQTKILNAERVPGAPLTLQLTDVPEQQALDTLLRALSGYVASPRAEMVSNLSRFDRIAIMPTPAPVMSATATASSAPPPFPQPPPPFQTMAPVADDQQDAPNRAPVFNQFPPPQVANPVQQNMPMPTPGVLPAPGPLVLPSGAVYPGAPTAPVGSSVPGMPVATPGQPTQPKRPGGGGQ